MTFKAMIEKASAMYLHSFPSNISEGQILQHQCKNSSPFRDLKSFCVCRVMWDNRITKEELWRRSGQEQADIHMKQNVVSLVGSYHATFKYNLASTEIEPSRD